MVSAVLFQGWLLLDGLNCQSLTLAVSQLHSAAGIVFDGSGSTHVFFCYNFSIWSSANGFSGPLPNTIQQWTNLSRFRAAFNMLNGTLPEGIGSSWSQLTDFFVRDNQLSGTLPASLSQWSDIGYVFWRLYIVWVHWFSSNLFSQFNNSFFSCDVNRFIGTIPESYGNWTNLEIAFFDTNDLTGTVPESICTNNVGLTTLWADCLVEIECAPDCCTMCVWLFNWVCRQAWVFVFVLEIK